MRTRTIGGRIRHLREQHRITQQNLSDRLYVSRKTVSSWERDYTEPTGSMAVKLAKLLDTSLDYLLTGRKSKL